MSLWDVVLDAGTLPVATSAGGVELLFQDLAENKRLFLTWFDRPWPSVNVRSCLTFKHQCFHQYLLVFAES